MIHRRDLLALGAAPWLLPRPLRAQQAPRSYLLGWLSSGASRGESYNLALVQRLRELGFVEGSNLSIHFRSADGQADRLPALARELAALRCDAYLAPGPEVTLVALKQATRDAPIIFAANDYDPVATGHVESLARPGGRITGVYQLQEELSAKRIELLKALVPRAHRVAVLADVATGGQLGRLRQAAPAMGLDLLVHQFARGPYDFDAAFAGLAAQRADALLPLGSGLFVPARQRITALALRHHLPGMFNNALWTEVGGLASYGVNFSAAYRRAADQIAQVLQGAPAGSMPVEQSTVIEMVVNLRTAKALSVAIPQAILLRADRVIE